MRLTSIAALLLCLAACSHIAAPVSSAENNEIDTTPQADSDDVDIPDEMLEDSSVSLKGDQDRAFLESSLALALHPWNRSRLASEIRAYVRAASRRGRFPVGDSARGNARLLKFVAVRDRVMELLDGGAAVCTDFVDERGEKVDVDFTFTPSDAGGADSISGFEIHRVNGHPRFTYLEKEGAWVRSPRTAVP